MINKIPHCFSRLNDWPFTNLHVYKQLGFGFSFTVQIVRAENDIFLMFEVNSGKLYEV